MVVCAVTQVMLYNIIYSISTISQMYSSDGCKRSSVAHPADNRYFNNNTSIGKQGARGIILFFPYVSNTLHSKYERINMGESHIYLQSYNTTWITWIWIHHNSKACTHDIKFNWFIYHVPRKCFVIVVLKFLLYRYWLNQVEIVIP